MTASQSDLSSAKYGYDIVVATTQGSINSTMKQYLSALEEPTVKICFVADHHGVPAMISYEELLEQANGSDPFSIPPDTDPHSSPEIQNLIQARFMVGIEAQIGLPPGYAPADVPDIVTLPTKTGPVTYNLLCSKFQVVELIPGGGYNPEPTWQNIEQPDGGAWIFKSTVDLNLSTVEQDKYKILPKAVQNQIKNLGGSAFSVQQLLFDLSNAGLSSDIPTIKGIKPGTKLFSLVEQYFLGAYFTEMQKKGQPLLGASITANTAPASTLTVTDLNFMNNPLVGSNGEPVAHPSAKQRDLATLDYLCAAKGHTLPPANNFDWNWVDSSDQGKFDGVVAINRSAFVNYLDGQLRNQVSKNCYKSWVRVWLTGVFDQNVHFQWSMTPGQTATKKTPSGNTLLTYSYASSHSDEAGLGGDMGKLVINTSYNLVAEVSGNTMTITQTMVVYIEVRGLFGVDNSGNIVDKKIVDTYTIAASPEGKLVTTLKSVPTDTSVDPSTNGFSNFWGGDINGVTKSVKDWIRHFTATNFEDIPVGVAQNFVFPGGRTFAYKSAQFSDNQDLVAHITYANPT